MVSKEVLADVVPNVSVDVVSKKEEKRRKKKSHDDGRARREGQGAEARTYPWGLAEAVAHTSSIDCEHVIRDARGKTVGGESVSQQKHDRKKHVFSRRVREDERARAAETGTYCCHRRDALPLPTSE